MTLQTMYQPLQDLDAGRHARIVGAAGSGKTTMLVAQVVSWLDSGRFAADEVLVLAHNRSTVTRLRDLIESQLAGSLAGVLVRTPVSLALHLLNEDRAAHGHEPLQLMMGTRQDEMIRVALESFESAELGGFNPEVLEGQAFRTELRDLWRVLDEFQLSPDQLGQERLSSEKINEIAGAALPSPQSAAAVKRFSPLWASGASVIDRAAAEAAERFPNELPASAVLAHAVRYLRDGGANAPRIPRLVLVDDAADLGEGALALLAQLSNLGTAVWVFGDPDVSTVAFQGEPTRVLAGLHRELERRGARGLQHRGDEQMLVLEAVHRHAEPLRGLIRALSQRIGTSAGWQQRSAQTQLDGVSSVEFTSVHTFSEQMGVIAYRLRSRHLGLHQTTAAVAWKDMAVICRSGDQVARVAQALEALRVPTRVASGGLVLGRAPVVREFLGILAVALGIADVAAHEIREYLVGVVGGLDSISLRRLDHAVMISDRRAAVAETREPRSLAAAYEHLLDHPESIPDLAEGRALTRLARVFSEARKVAASSATPREVLWAAWSASGLQTVLRDRALEASGVASVQAHAHLDAIMELFFVLQRHEEQVSDVPIADLIHEVLTSDVAQDSLVSRSERDAVIITTPQGAVGEEFHTVCIAGPQEGIWPNVRPRGSLVGAAALHTVLRGDTLDGAVRTHTLHDELRLFVTACSRARAELLVVAREDEEEYPSPFYHLGIQFQVKGLPDATLTLSGYVAELRRRLVNDPGDTHAASTLQSLAAQGVRGAHPGEWYGIRPPSTTQPLVDLSDPEAVQRVSPSRIETAEECPLHWFTSTFGRDSSPVSAQLGTLIHHAFEQTSGNSELEMRRVIDAEWNHLDFDAEWQSDLMRDVAYRMVQGLADYARDHKDAGGKLLASEATFSIQLGQVSLGGTADRVELRRGEDGALHPVIVDVKTGRSYPTAAAVESHAQLLAYQLGLLTSEFRTAETQGEGAASPVGAGQTGALPSFEDSGGAALVYVHPDATTKRSAYREIFQTPMGAAERTAFEVRVAEVARIMAGATFTASVEHHCLLARGNVSCTLHITPAVSYE